MVGAVVSMAGAAAVSMAADALTLQQHVVDAAEIRCPQVRAGHPWSRQIAHSRTLTTATSETHRTFPPRFPARTPIQVFRDRASGIPPSLPIISARHRALHSQAVVLPPAFRREPVTAWLASMGSAVIRLADSAAALAAVGDSGA